MAGKRPTQAGMTLIELLIAVAVGAIVLAALNSVVSLGLQAQAAGRQQNELVFQARFALERMVTTARSVAPAALTTPTVSTTCGGVGAPVAVAGGSTVTLPAGSSIPIHGSCTLTVTVTAAAGGSHSDNLFAGDLVTSKGTNAAQAIATLTVIPPGPSLPTLGMDFSPTSVNAGGVSTLTVTLGNPNGSVATLTAPLIDSLPSGLVIAPAPNASTSCGGGTTVAATAGGTSATLPAGSSIPAYGSCTLKVDVKEAGGSYINNLLAGALVTSNGNNAAQTSVALTIIPAGNVQSLGNAFNPASINASGVSTLTITLFNASAQVSTLLLPLIDTMPSGVVIAAMPSAVVLAATPAAGTTGNWFSPVMYCCNSSCNGGSSSSQLIETTTANYATNGCTGAVIAGNVNNFSAQLPSPSLAQCHSSSGPVDRPAGTLSLTLAANAAPQPVTLCASVRLGGGTL